MEVLHAHCASVWIFIRTSLHRFMISEATSPRAAAEIWNSWSGLILRHMVEGKVTTQVKTFTGGADDPGPLYASAAFLSR